MTKYVVTLGSQVFEVTIGGDHVTVNDVARPSSFSWIRGTPIGHVSLDGRQATYGLWREAGCWVVLAGGVERRVRVEDERTYRLRQLSGASELQDGGGQVSAPMPGLVLRVEVEVGQVVEAGTGVIVLEAMKMENEIRTPVAGTIRAIHVEAGQAVEKGAMLVEVIGRGSTSSTADDIVKG